MYFPQKNGMLFYFGQDANIVWQHGINALPDEEQDGKGRISIILWGLCKSAVDELGSPPMLTDETRDKGKRKGQGQRRLLPCTLRARKLPAETFSVAVVRMATGAGFCTDK